MRLLKFFAACLAVLIVSACAAAAQASGVDVVSFPPLQVAVEHFAGFTGHVDAVAVGGITFASLASIPMLGFLRGPLMDPPRDRGADQQTAPTQQQPAQQGTYIQLTDEQFRQLANLPAPQPTPAEVDAEAERQAQGNPQQGRPGATERTLAPEQSRELPTAGQDREREARLAHHTLQMLAGIRNRNFDQVRTAQRELARDGHYGQEGRERAAGDYYSTLVDADGAVLLPTVVVQQIEEIGEVLGVAQQVCTVFNHIVGTLKVPGATGTLRASAVAEGGTISSSMRQFQAVDLNPKKWALIIPWTYEANLEAGPQILADAQRAIARGFAYAEDDAFINGDGTAAFNSIDGILSSNRTNVKSYVLAAGNTSFDDLSADDVFLCRRAIAPAVRNEASYLFHPDSEPKLRTLKDGNGSYIYAYNADTGVATLGGRPVRYTEVLPSIADDAVSTPFGLFGAFRYVKMAIGQGMTSEEMREGAVEDADTGATINLGAQDMRALKVRKLFDLDMNFEEAITTIETPAA